MDHNFPTEGAVSHYGNAIVVPRMANNNVDTIFLPLAFLDQPRGYNVYLGLHLEELEGK